jgi:KUP system potassium uptake protein
LFVESGTSPLYVLDTIFSNKNKLPNEFQCIGAVSLIIWSLILVVSIKYAIFILKADNKGEGFI